jgi:hypothetical protein
MAKKTPKQIQKENAELQKQLEIMEKIAVLARSMKGINLDQQFSNLKNSVPNMSGFIDQLQKINVINKENNQLTKEYLTKLNQVSSKLSSQKDQYTGLNRQAKTLSKNFSTSSLRAAGSPTSSGIPTARGTSPKSSYWSKIGDSIANAITRQLSKFLKTKLGKYVQLGATGAMTGIGIWAANTKLGKLAGKAIMRPVTFAAGKMGLGGMLPPKMEGILNKMISVEEIFRKFTTTTSQDYRKELVNIQRSTGRFGGTLDSTQQAYSVFFNDVARFTEVGKPARKQILTLSTILADSGVKTKTTSDIYDHFLSAVGRTPTQIKGMIRSLHDFGRVLKLDVNKVMQDLVSVQDDLIVFNPEKQAQIVRTYLTFAKKTGISTKKLNKSFGDGLDTFEKASSFAAKFNVLFKTRLSPMALLRMDPAERMMTIKRAMEASGKTFANMPRFLRKFAGKMLPGFGTTDVSRMMKRSAFEIQSAMAMGVGTKPAMSPEQLALRSAKLDSLWKATGDRAVLSNRRLLGSLENLNGSLQRLRNQTGGARAAIAAVASGFKGLTAGAFGFVESVVGLFSKNARTLLNPLIVAAKNLHKVFKALRPSMGRLATVAGKVMSKNIRQSLITLVNAIPAKYLGTRLRASLVRSFKTIRVGGSPVAGTAGSPAVAVPMSPVNVHVNLQLEGKTIATVAKAIHKEIQPLIDTYLKTKMKI